MASGMSGPAGAPALPPVLMGPCREPGSVMAPHMGVLSAEASGWRLSTASLESVRWMASGRPGPCGRVVLKPAEGGVSRETGFVMGPFLEGSLVLESGKRSAAVTKRDAQNHMKYVEKTTTLMLCGR